MDEQDELGIPLAVVFFVIALVIALVIGLGVWKMNQGVGVEVVEVVPTPVGEIKAEAAAEAQPYAPETETTMVFSDVAPVGDAQLKVYFNVGQTDLSDEAKANIAALSNVIKKMEAGDAVVLISGFHDESGTAQVNAEVAKNRAVAVRDALVLEGVPAAMIQLRKPEVTLGEGEPAEARRVEVRVQ